ncbi:MAG: phage tail tube protein [Candidatus Woesearchaeota archaeon]
MAILTGNKAKLQIGKETTWGTLVTTTQEYAFFSEDLKETREKKVEGVIVGAKGEPANYTTKIQVEGGFSCLARPDDIGYLIGGALGAEGTVITQGTNGKKHTFTAIEMSESASLPSFSVKIDRVADIFGYSGFKIDELKLSGSAGDFVKVDVKGVGKNEEVGTTLASLSKSSRRPFKFTGGSLTFGTTDIEITSFDFNYKNNLQKDIQTNLTGLYTYEPQPAQRQITFNIETLFDDNSIEQYTDYYKTDNTFALELKFTSDEEIETGLNYSMTITISTCQITTSDFGVKGTEVLKHSFSLKAIDSISDELITVELVNTNASKYI